MPVVHTVEKRRIFSLCTLVGVIVAGRVMNEGRLFVLDEAVLGISQPIFQPNQSEIYFPEGVSSDYLSRFDPRMPCVFQLDTPGKEPVFVSVYFNKTERAAPAITYAMFPQ